MRRFVVLGQKAKASGDFLLADIPSTSGRLDVLLRALRASLLVSHGVRRDSCAYLALLGEPDNARVVRLSGAAARYLRPDERSLATTLKKALAAAPEGEGFSAARPGIDVARGGFEVLGAELQGSAVYLLELGGVDIREAPLGEADPTFVLGDHLGMTAEARAFFLALGARALSVGPTALYTEDVIAIVANELDRRAAPTADADGGGARPCPDSGV
jgi:tRNA (pseudouridine54-N1)-methyltransferase